MSLRTPCPPARDGGAGDGPANRAAGCPDFVFGLVSHVRNPHPKKVLHVGHAVAGIGVRGVGVGVGRGARGGPRPHRGASRAVAEDTPTNFFSITTDQPYLKCRALPPAREPTIHQAHGLGAGLAMRSAAARSGLAGPGG